MKKTIRTLLLCFCFAAARSYAGSDYKSPTATDQPATTFPFEFDAEYAYIGESDVERGYRKNRNIDENYYSARFVYTPRIKFGILRLGVAYERFDFGGLDSYVVPAGSLLPGFQTFHSEIPDTLQSISGIIGLDTKFSDSLLFRIEAQPGLYGTDELDGDMFNIPIVVGGTYIYNADLQFIFGVSVDYERKYPVLPGGGVRWRFASQWVLNAALPTPRLEFEATKQVTIYAGADLKGSTFRVDDNFARRNLGGGYLTTGDQRLNHAVLTYTEIRTGLGVDWKITPDVKLSVEGGYLPYREFDYYRADIRYKYDTGAPYGAVALHAAF